MAAEEEARRLAAELEARRQEEEVAARRAAEKEARRVAEEARKPEVLDEFVDYADSFFSLVPLTDDNGVLKEIISKGEKGVVPHKGDTVKVHYEGRLVDGSIFDSSYKRGEPFEVEIGVGNVVRGWDIGIPSMELGEKAELTIKSDYGYGDRARPKIPRRSTMIFTVELLGINGREPGYVEPEPEPTPAFPIFDRRPTGLGPPNYPQRPL